jgi:protein-tyrosine-phosphatase
MTARVHHVLFLCTGNSARSIMAEAILDRLGAGRFRAHSAGSHPKSAPHPMALAELEGRGHDTTGFRSKGWEEFAGPDAPGLDFVFTVCDAARGESCPVWPGAPVTAHWGVEDPAAFDAEPPDEQRRIFARVYDELERRIRAFLDLPLDDLDLPTLQRRLDAIGGSSAEPAA